MSMNLAFDLLFAQTWQVGLLGLAVWSIVRFCGGDRPHLSHCLWSLVLLKCLMPPIWTSPVGLFCWLGPYTHPSTAFQWLSLPLESPPGAVGLAAPPELAIRIVEPSQDSLLGSSASPHTPAQASPSQPTPPVRGQQAVLVVWLLGGLLSLSVALVRLKRFGKTVRETSSTPRSTQACPSWLLERLADRLSRQLQVRQKVSVLVIDAAVGPAVYGLLRPRVLLPAAIVRERSLQELEPLLAHELIHVRRGDLWWAMVQTLACSLLWFHPVVWLAQRRLVRESERCCDEETVASLQCSPADYAGCLLGVLESKQRLRVAPALPGVRPVDVTRNRLERIMRLGKGSHASTPVWIWLLFLVSLAMLLPGGAWLQAQEGQSATVSPDANLTPNAPEVKSASAVNSKPGPVPRATGAWAESWKSESIDVSDLLDKLEAKHGDREAARAALLKMLPQRSIQAINAEGNVSMSAVPAFEIDQDSLHLFETEQQRKEIKRLIEQLRRFGFDSIRTEVRLLAISGKLLDALEIEWEAAATPTREFIDQARPSPANKVASAAQTSVAPPQPAAPANSPVQPASANAAATPSKSPSTPTTPMDSALSPETVYSDLGIAGTLVRDHTEADTTTPTFCAVIDTQQAMGLASLGPLIAFPRVSGRNGTVTQMQAYESWSVTPRIADFSKPSTNPPKPQLGFSGFSLAVCPLITTEPEENGDSSLEISLACEVREVTRLDKFTFEGRHKTGGTAAPTETTVEQPHVVLKTLAARHHLQPGQSLLLSSRQPLAPESENKVLVIVATCEVLPAGSP